MENKELYIKFVAQYRRALSKRKELSLKLEAVETELKGVKSPKLNNPSRIVSHINRPRYALYDKKEQLLTRINCLNTYIIAFENALLAINNKVYLPYFLLYSFKQLTISQLAYEIGVSKSVLAECFNSMIDEFVLKNKTRLNNYYNEILLKV